MARSPDGARARKAGAARGMVLTEVMMSMLLLIVAAAGSVGMVLVTIRGNAFAGHIQTATKLGQHLVDQLMMEPFATLGVGASACRPAVVETVYATGGATVGGAGDTLAFERTCSIAPLPNGMKVIRVSVGWQDEAGKAHTVNLGSQRAP